jgi:hypothetical protein
MTENVIVALVIACLSLLGTAITIFTSASKSDLAILRGIIAELREQVDELESVNNDLETWAEQLCCQVKGLGQDPVKFVRHKQVKQKDK